MQITTPNEKIMKLSKIRITLSTSQNEKPTLKARGLKANNFFANYYFHTEEQRRKYLKRILRNAYANEKQKKSRRESRKSTPEKLAKVQPGIIFYSSWGYDQTNVDFYQVKSVKGNFAIIQEIRQESEPGSSELMSSSVKGIKNAFIGDEIRKKINFNSWNNDPYFHFNGFNDANVWDGKSKYCSWYA
jgi:hypothetical protein